MTPSRGRHARSHHPRGHHRRRHGRPRPRRATSACGTGASSPCRPRRRRRHGAPTPDRRRGPRRARRRRARRLPRLRRPAHPLRRPAVLGPAAPRPSNVHGVTHGRSAATAASRSRRCTPSDADYLRRMMAKVEGMPLAALEHGRRLELGDASASTSTGSTARIGVNAGFLVGHCALRRYVMGADADRQRGDARADRRDGARCCTRRSRPAALGFSTTLSFTALRRRRPAGGVALGDAATSCSRCARRSASTRAPRSRASSRAASTSSATTRSSCWRRCRPPRGRPINWNVLTVDSREPERVAAPARRRPTAAAEAGGRVVALTMPVLVPMNMSFRNYCALCLHPGLGRRHATCRSPERIERARATPRRGAGCSSASHSEEAGVFRRLADWGRYVIGDTYSDANEGLKGRVVGDIAAERGPGRRSTRCSTS